MATSTKRDVQLAVQITTAGESELARVVASVRTLAQEGGDAAEDFQRLATQLDALAQRAGELDEVKGLVADFERLTEAQRESTAAAQAAQDKFREQAAAMTVLRAAEQQAVEQIRLAKQALADRTLELTRATVAAREAGLTGKELAAATKDQALAVAEQKQALAGLNTDRERATAAVRSALPLERQLSTAYERTSTEAAKAQNALDRQARALQSALDSAQAAGRSIDDLGQAERDLAEAAQAAGVVLQNLEQRRREDAAAAAEGAAAMRLLERASIEADKALVEHTRSVVAEEAALRGATEAARAKRFADYDAIEALAVKETRSRLAAEAARALQQAEAQAAGEQKQIAAEAKAAADDAAAATARAAAAQRQLEQSAREAAAEQRKLEESLQGTQAAARAYAATLIQVTSAGEQDVAALRARRAAAEALIASDERLTDAQRGLANASNATRAALLAQAQAYLASSRAADESQRATANLVREARSAGDVLEKAFGQTGVRSLQAIEAEIKSVDLAVSLLERRMRAGALSQDDFARASSSAQVRLQTLKREMATIPQIDGLFERTNAAVLGLINRFGALTAAVGTVGLAVKPVLDATIALEQMRRTLTTVSGSAESAEAQIEFLRNTSQRAGQSFTEVGQSYAKFAASALQTGTSLKVVQEVFESVSLAAGNLGLSSDQSKRALEALSQIASKGVVNMEELRQQLGDALPGVLPLLAKELGLTTAELNKVVESGQLLASEAIPAIGRSLQGLQPRSGVVNGLVAEFNRFVNVVKEAGVTIVEGPLGAAAGAVLSGLSSTIQNLAFWAVSASEGIKFLGNVIGITAGFVASGAKDWNAYRDALSEVAEEGGAKISAFAARVNNASKSTREFGTGVTALGGSFARLALDQQKAIDGAVLQAQNAEKGAQAAQKQADTVVKLAEALGDEGAARQGAIEGAELYLKAVEAQLAADERVLATYRESLLRLEEKAVAEGKGRDAIKATAEALADKASKAEADVEKTRASAEAARAHAEAMALDAEKARDNSGRIDELRASVAAAETAFKRSRDIVLSHTGVSKDLKERTEALAKAKGLLRDALDDMSDALERQLGLLRADYALQEAGLKLELERVKNDQRRAELAGNEYAARQASIRVKEIELALDRSSRDLKTQEIEAGLEALRVQERELQVLGQLTPERAIEIETRRKNLLAQQLENQATEEASKVKVEELRNIKSGTTARGEYTKATGDSTTATNSNTESTRSNTSALTEAEKATNALANARKAYNKLLNEDPGRLVGGSGLGGISYGNNTGVRGVDGIRGVDGVGSNTPSGSVLGPSKIGPTGSVVEGGSTQAPVPPGYYYTLDPYDPNVERSAGTDSLGRPYPGYFAKIPGYRPEGANAPGVGPFGGTAGARPSPSPAPAPTSGVSAAPTAPPLTDVSLVRVELVLGGQTTTGYASQALIDALKEAERQLGGP